MSAVKHKIILVEAKVGLGQLIHDGEVRTADIWHGFGSADELRGIDSVSIRNEPKVRDRLEKVGEVDYRGDGSKGYRGPVFRWECDIVPKHVKDEVEADPYAFGTQYVYDADWK